MDQDLERFKLKRMIQKIKNMSGTDTSMISLYIKPGSVSQIKQKLTMEEGAASNIKSRTNRLSVISAIKSTKALLQRYNNTPPNGLVIFCGFINGKKININFQPPEPLQSGLYFCGNYFETKCLNYLFEEKNNYGFVILDGSEFIIAVTKGNKKDIKFRKSVNLPRKHNKGGQSSARFGRIRQEKIAQYITNIAESMNKAFIDKDLVSVKSIILAGPGGKKELIIKSDILDHRLKQTKITILDIQYSGINGLNQAINESKKILQSNVLTEETDLLQKFFTELSVNFDSCAYSLKNVMTCIQNNWVKTLIVWENLDFQRVTFYNKETDETLIEHDNNIIDTLNCVDNIEIKNSEPLLDWLLENYKEAGIDSLFLISDSTSEGHQFCQSFAGIGAHLRYPIDITEYEPEFLNEDDDSDSKFDFM